MIRVTEAIPMPQTTPPSRDLHNLRILVVEDRAPVALALCAKLEDRGATIVGPAARLMQASALAEQGGIDVAVLDIDLDGVNVYPLARYLRGRKVPVILMTGYAALDVPADLRQAPLLDKLASMDELAETIAGLARACERGRPDDAARGAEGGAGG
jgi:CheY-like chemotaxis protein